MSEEAQDPLADERAALAQQAADLEAARSELAAERAAVAERAEAVLAQAAQLAAARTEGLAADAMRAKFVVASMSRRLDGSAEVVLQPAAQGSDDNAEFFRATPWGEIRMGTVTPAVAERFAAARQFYVDFTPAPGKQ